jgi:hypothetical protein
LGNERLQDGTEGGVPAGWVGAAGWVGGPARRVSGTAGQVGTAGRYQRRKLLQYLRILEQKKNMLKKRKGHNFMFSFSFFKDKNIINSSEY